MAVFELRFTIPGQRHGEREAYKAFAGTLRELNRLKGKSEDGAKVLNVDVSGGSINGQASIESDSYQGALALCCRKTPVIDLEWHLEERIDSNELSHILEEAMKKRIA